MGKSITCTFAKILLISWCRKSLSSTSVTSGSHQVPVYKVIADAFRLPESANGEVTIAYAMLTELQTPRRMAELGFVSNQLISFQLLCGSRSSSTQAAHEQPNTIGTTGCVMVSSKTRMAEESGSITAPSLPKQLQIQSVHPMATTMFHWHLVVLNSSFAPRICYHWDRCNKGSSTAWAQYINISSQHTHDIATINIRRQVPKGTPFWYDSPLADTT